MNTRIEQFAIDTKPDLILLIDSVRAQIDDDCMQEGDDPTDYTPSIQLTISTNDSLSEWSYQTGDNSYTGSCYHHPHWGVGYVTEECDASELADDLIDQLLDLVHETALNV